ncbi:NAD+ synthase [Rhodohalobacter mucosus]|uniref:Glutamine-dependent NAD(+) synthetase n=2 Tax=Rhodohalobacter mucosus TaxID=2079485 RepID=A0A316TNK8_9BACT|nr:NAD+ synthase [Rhodohalobacter mucosus]
MKVRVEQLNPIAGDLEGNKDLILKSLRKAEKDGINLLILPELVVTAYPVHDLLESDTFRQACYRVNEEIISATKSTAILFGSITPNAGLGRKMFNSALLSKNGKLIQTVHKSLLPTYDVFDDLRYFEPAGTLSCMELDGLRLGVTVCEDIWYNENEIQYHTYPIDPAMELKKMGARAIVNISASPYTNRKHENRVNMLKNHVKRLGIPLFYSNQTGANTELIFDGDSMIIDSDASVIAAVGSFSAGYTDVKWNVSEGENSVKALEKSKKIDVYPASGPARQFEAIRCGLSDYLGKTGVTGDVVLGLSGGIDSALVCTLAAEILGPEHVTAITMPSEFSSEGSVTHSEELAHNLGITLHNVPIGTLFKEHRSVLDPLFEGTSFGVAEENLQSRIRGALLMAYSNKFNAFLLATGNKSEYAVGYATLYGDMNGALSLIGDLYKTEVYALSAWLNEVFYEKEVIPAAVIEKEPSAELRPGQKDSDTLPGYDILDDILYRYIELQQGVKDIISAGHDADNVQRVVRMVDMNEFKRNQAVPILKLSSKSFGTGRRWPIVQRWTSRKNS